jgi:hypothetical protein
LVLGGLTTGDYHPGDDPTRLRTRGKPETKLVVETVRHEDGLSRDEIQRVMERLRSQVKNCYERELGAAPDLEGKVALGFVIDASGDVATTMVHQNTLAAEPGKRTGACIQKVVGRAKFPSPRGGGTVAVTYPFVLSSSP